MNKLIYSIKIYLAKENGISATEYGLIIAGISLTLILVFSVVTGAFNDGFQFILNTINEATGR
jgi:Flp pilus assembly pilin Flp